MPSPSKLSRRDLLMATPLVAAAAAACRRPPYDARAFRIPERSAVALMPAAGYTVDLSDIVFRGLQLLSVNVRGQSVFLKPNLVEYEPGTVINTHPLVVAGAAAALLRAGAREITVGEGPGHRRDIEYLLAATGLAEPLKDLRLRFVDLNHDDVRIVPLKSRFTDLVDLALPVELLRSDFVVSVAKLKTHHWSGLTASMKNLFGTVPGAVYGWPKNVLHYRGIDNSILDLTATIRPQLAIVDAIVAMEGDGPIMGRPRHMGFLAIGTDLVSVDATCARIIGFDARKIPYLDRASRYLGNLAESRIDQRGESPSRYRTRFEVIDAFAGLQVASGG